MKIAISPVNYSSKQINQNKKFLNNTANSNNLYEAQNQNKVNPKLALIYFGATGQTPKQQLQAIINEKISKTGEITPDMVDDNMSRLLMKIAIEQTNKSYAPYSNIHVGSAIISKSGHIYDGCNVENASYGLASCAERTAIFKMVSEEGVKDIGKGILGPQIAAMATIVKESPTPASSCGACRQVINEFDFNQNAKLIYGNMQGELYYTTIKQVLPDSFGPHNIFGAEG